MTEVASIPLIVAASYFAVVAEHRRPALAGALAALSIYLRYQNGLVAAGLLLILLARREWPLVRRYLIGAVPVGLAGGLLDWATWKYPFQSFIVYVKFNLIEGKASDFGRSPFGFYAEMLAGSIGVSFGAVLLGLAASARRALGLVVLVAVYFLAHSVIPHKELRFMLPMLPLALILAAVGLTELARALWPDGRFAVVAAALFALIMGWDAAHPLARDYGRGDGNWILWHAGQDYFEVDWAAEKQPDLCGIAMVGNHPAWTGGYTYLHRNVPIYFDLGHLGSTNYVVGGKAERMTREWTKVFESGNYALYHRAGGCAPDPNYKPWL